MQNTFAITTITDGFYIFLATEHNWLSAASNCITFSSYIFKYVFSVSTEMLQKWDEYFESQEQEYF